MPSNPMQRKSRNAFLLGMLLTLIIVLTIGLIVYVLVINPKTKKKDKNQTFYVNTYRLKQGMNVKSGEELSTNMLEEVQIPVATETVATDFIKNKVEVTGCKSKIDLTGGTILTKNMIYSEETPDSLRYVEYNMLVMPTLLDIGSYIDIRLKLPNSQDFIVISKKEVVNLYGETVGLNLTEEEILVLNSAIVEAYIMPASELYATLYVEAGIQETAQTTYIPTDEIVNLIQMDPNIVDEARKGLIDLYSKYVEINGKTYSEREVVRGYINNSEKTYAEDRDENIENAVQTQIQKAKQARKNYLSGLNGY